MITRKLVLETIREEVNINSWATYSEPNQTHQRVKWYGCSADVDAIRKVLNEHGFKDVTVETSVIGRADSINLRFPFELYC